mmetsp:Transcript_8154/g.26763  ORF Transcript_8154/g.26763 Transcript_8154/m.26763 type:complete len:255 (-) Transcript_8154:2199-2963(-)
MATAFPEACARAVASMAMEISTAANPGARTRTFSRFASHRISVPSKCRASVAPSWNRTREPFPDSGREMRAWVAASIDSSFNRRQTRSDPGLPCVAEEPSANKSVFAPLLCRITTVPLPRTTRSTSPWPPSSTRRMRTMPSVETSSVRPDGSVVCKHTPSPFSNLCTTHRAVPKSHTKSAPNPTAPFLGRSTLSPCARAAASRPPSAALRPNVTSSLRTVNQAALGPMVRSFITEWSAGKSKVVAVASTASLSA